TQKSARYETFNVSCKASSMRLSMLSKMRGMVCLLLALFSAVTPHTILDIVVDNEIQFLVCEAVVFGEDAVYFVDDGFRLPNVIIDFSLLTTISTITYSYLRMFFKIYQKPIY